MPAFIIASSLFILFISGFLFHKASGSLSITKINLISWIFYVQLILQSFIGVSLAFMGVSHYVFSRVSSYTLGFSYFATAYVLICMPLSMIFVQRIFFGGKIRFKLNSYLCRQLKPLQSTQDSTQILFWVLISLLSFLATAYVYANTRSIPFLALVSGSDDAALLRQSATRGFSGNVYIRNLLSLLLSQFVSYVAFAYFLMNKNLVNRIWVVFSGLSALLALSYSGEKAPIIYYFIGLFLIDALAKGRFNLKNVSLLVALVGIIIAVLYASLGQLFIAVNGGPLGRILMTQIAGLAIHLEIFPKYYDFLWGASFPSWMTSVVGIEHMRSGRLAMTYFNPAGVEAGTAGVMNTLFIAEAWANFSWFGLLISPIIVGTVVQFLHNLFLTLPKSPVYLAALVYFMLRIPITGGFIDFLWNVVWFFLLMVILLGFYIRPVLMGAKKAQVQR